MIFTREELDRLRARFVARTKDTYEGLMGTELVLVTQTEQVRILALHRTDILLNPTLDTELLCLKKGHNSPSVTSLVISSSYEQPT